MVLRKERPATATKLSKPTQTTMSNEQPLTKRQRIELTNRQQQLQVHNNNGTPTSAVSTNGSESTESPIIRDHDFHESAPPPPPAPPDILQINESPLSSSLSSSSQSIISSTSPSSSVSSLSQLFNGTSKSASLAPLHSLRSCSSSSVASCSDSPEISADEVDKAIINENQNNMMILPDLLPKQQNVSSTTKCSNLANSAISPTTSTPAAIGSTNEMGEFEESLIIQCLCGVSERTLRKPFQSHYSHDIKGVKRIANLNEWPTNKLLQFLSNLQLLFDIYLKQNSKGFICSRIMDVCDALIRNDHNLIDEIIVLSNFNNHYVQFLSGRVLASFLVIAKNQMDDNWLKKIINNLFSFERLDQVAVQKIHFSLEIIKRVVEWKDIDLHPLEDEINTNRSNSPEIVNSAANTGSTSTSTTALASSSSSSFTHLINPHNPPPLENNYFAINFHESENEFDDEASGSSGSRKISNSRHQHSSNQASEDARNQRNINLLQAGGCNLVTLTDSESFDTTHLKCVTIKILENKWPALVKNMSNLISNHIEIDNAENCILNFLHLWENIISVKANLSIVETLPFYAQLDKFELLLNQNLPCTIYKQMLCLFNEALCYGSTLALQDLLPDETCMLAHQIVRHVKDFRILESLPRRQPDNMVSLIGFKGKTIVFEPGTLQQYVDGSNQLEGGGSIEMDKTILQKMVLLVLKSIAVTVKEIRSDSSDSSIDSSDYDAFQDMVLIERSIRDVLRKLESFIKNTLEFHPECHFSKILIYLFDDQDDHLIEAMVCTLDVTAGISFRNNAFPELVSMLNPIYTFLEFLKMISNSSDLLLDLLVSNETCFLLYLLRFLKYIRLNWPMFVQSCHNFSLGQNSLDEAMSVLIRLRLQISRLVSRSLYPYDISPVLRLLESCESLYEGNELS